MSIQINKSIVKKVRDYRVDKGLGVKAIAKLLPPTRTGNIISEKQVKRYWNYGIDLGIVTASDLKIVKKRMMKHYPKANR